LRDAQLRAYGRFVTTPPETEPPATEALPLRDRKKLATRQALSDAALRLALERGVENVRVEDIAAAAGVSPRTYNNYFSSRAEAICVADGAERALRLAAALRERPADEALFDAVRAVVDEHITRAALSKKHLRILLSAPALQGEHLKVAVLMERALAEAIADRLGVDGGRDLRPRVLAGAVLAAIRAAREHWLRSTTRAAYSKVVLDALDCLAPAFGAASC